MHFEIWVQFFPYLSLWYGNSSWICSIDVHSIGGFVDLWIGEDERMLEFVLLEEALYLDKLYATSFEDFSLQSSGPVGACF